MQLAEAVLLPSSPHRADRGAVAARRAVHRLHRAASGRPFASGRSVLHHCARDHVVLDGVEHAHGSGPFVRASITHSVLASQLFVTVAALTSLILAAVTARSEPPERARRSRRSPTSRLRCDGSPRSSRVRQHRTASFEQVTVEAAQTLGASAASLARFEEDGTVTFVGGWSDTGRLAFPVGSRVPVEETGVLAEIRKTGRGPSGSTTGRGRPEIVERLSSWLRPGRRCADQLAARSGAPPWRRHHREEPLAPGSELPFRRLRPSSSRKRRRTPMHTRSFAASRVRDRRGR